MLHFFDTMYAVHEYLRSHGYKMSTFEDWDGPMGIDPDGLVVRKIASLRRHEGDEGEYVVIEEEIELTSGDIADIAEEEPDVVADLMKRFPLRNFS